MVWLSSSSRVAPRSKARVLRVLLALAALAAACFVAGLAQAQTPADVSGGDTSGVIPESSPGPSDLDPPFVFHGDFTTERKSEIRASYDSVAEWFRRAYGESVGGFTIYIGADHTSVLPVLEAQGLPLQGTPCFWSSASYVLVDGCEDPLPFARLYVYEMAWKLTGNPPIEVEDGHYRTGPVWLLHGAEEYGETAYRVAAGETEFATERRALLDRTHIGGVSLDDLETRSGFFAYSARATAWLTIDYLVQHAGERAYIDYFRLRRQHQRWEAAFDAAFEFTVDEFYAAFSAYPEQLRAAERKAEHDTYLEDWWRAAQESGRVKDVNVGDSPLWITWHGIDVSASFCLKSIRSSR